jgi:cobalt-zinc-cadmium efflux system protein
MLSLALVAALMTAQLVGYFLTHSLVIALDALHMFTDLGAIGLALFASWIARRPASPARTFGYYRAEILAALANGGALCAITFFLAREAWDRLADPVSAPVLEPRLMILFGSIALCANLTNAFVLHRSQHAHAHDESDDDGHAHDEHADLNLKGALLHVLGDVLGSLGAIAAGAFIYLRGWTWADAVFAAVMSVVILVSAFHLCVRAVDVLLESTPRHVDMTAFEAALRRVSGVVEIHDLHIWTLTGGVYAMSCHAAVASGADHARVLCDLQELVRSTFRIAHTTIQLEEHAALAPLEATTTTR